MKWWERKRKTSEERGPQTQLRQTQRNPYSGLEQYLSMQSGQTELYREVREAVPVVDAAIWKLVRLCGGVRAVTREAAQEGLDRFWNEVDTGYGQRGVQSFLDRYLDDMFTCGRGVGEMVLSQDPLDETRMYIHALVCGNPELLEFSVGEDGVEIQILQWENGELREVQGREQVLFTPFQPTSKDPFGASMLRGMPWLTAILTKIFQTTGQNWERAGDIRFALVCKPGEDEGLTQERCRALAEQWSRSMQSTRGGGVQDLVAVGDLDIKVIGADGPVLDSQVPVRQILEQLVARTGIPPFMLGLSWSTTERMSIQQADVLTSEITAIRRSLEPMVRRIAQTWLRLEGYDDWVEIEWADINLQDVVEEARAGLYQAQARKLRGEE